MQDVAIVAGIALGVAAVPMYAYYKFVQWLLKK